MATALFNENEIWKRETVEINGTTFGILFIYDQCPEHPRDQFSFAGVMIERQTRGYYKATIGDGPGWNSEDEFLKWAKRERCEVIQGDDGEFWYITPEVGQKEWGKIYGGKWRRAARACMEDQAAIIEAWREGNVFGWVLTDESESEQIESCWGFYGESNFEYMLDEATSAATAYANDPENRRFTLCFNNGISPAIMADLTADELVNIYQEQPDLYGKIQDVLPEFQNLSEYLQNMDLGECTDISGKLTFIIQRTK